MSITKAAQGCRILMPWKWHRCPGLSAIIPMEMKKVQVLELWSHTSKAARGVHRAGTCPGLQGIRKELDFPPAGTKEGLKSCRYPCSDAGSRQTQPILGKIKHLSCFCKYIFFFNVKEGADLGSVLFLLPLRRLTGSTAQTRLLGSTNDTFLWFRHGKKKKSSIPPFQAVSKCPCTPDGSCTEILCTPGCSRAILDLGMC